MLIALIAKDKPGALQTRKDNRAAHLAHIEASGIVAQAGPLIVDGEMAGSLIILDAQDMSAAQAFVDGDPYGQAGLFSSVELIEWKKVVG